MKQINLLKPESKSYGGTLLNTRKGRSHGRPLSTRHTMHLVLRSTKAVGDWSFKKNHNEKKIREIAAKFAGRYGIRIYSLANVGNHLHFHLKLTNRRTYYRFIRAVTAAIAMAVTGASRWRPFGVLQVERAKFKTRAPNSQKTTVKRLQFWDYRPFTRIVIGLRDFLGIQDYLFINELEGSGVKRQIAWRAARAKINWEFG